MKKAILISIQPKWVAKILNGEKTLEIRKTMPKCDLPIDVYIYCTKKDSLGRIKDTPRDRYFVDCVETPQDFKKMDSGYDGKGKVVAKFTLNKVEELDKFSPNKVNLKGTCVSYNEYQEYVGNKKCYGWHIDDLVIFDKPKEISEFRVDYLRTYNCDYGRPCSLKGKCGGVQAECCGCSKVIKAPQSWCYVEG